MSTIWSREDSQERFPNPITPLGYSLLRAPLIATLEALSRLLGFRPTDPDELVRRIDGYVYNRKGFFSDWRKVRLNPGPLGKIVAGLVWAVLLEGARFWRPRPALRIRQRWFALAFREQIETALRTWAETSESLKERLRRPSSQSLPANWNGVDLQKVFAGIRQDSEEFFALDFPVYYFKKLSAFFLKKGLQDLGWSPTEADEQISHWTQGMSELVSTRFVEDFPLLRTDPTVWKKKYGHLTDDWDLFQPFLWEKMSGLEKFASPTKKASAPRHRPPPVELEGLRRIFERLVLIDEEMRFASSLQYPELKILFRRIGERLVETGRLKSAEDIYFLFLPEIEREFEEAESRRPLGPLIEERRKEYEAAWRKTPPLEVQEGSLTAPLETKSSAQRLWPAESVSPGECRGEIRIVRQISDFQTVTKNHVIVVSQPHPLYAPFFIHCGGVVSETGGLLSHGAILAREYGVPMVVNLKGATQILHDGMQVSLDATRGVLKIL
jgi:phosphohistidine swiveling domain-containing protein